MWERKYDELMCWADRCPLMEVLVQVRDESDNGGFVLCVARIEDKCGCVNLVS